MVLLNKTLKASTENFGKEMLNTGSFTKLSKIVIATHTSWADQVVGMGPGSGIIVMRDTAHHHHGGALQWSVVSGEHRQTRGNRPDGDGLKQSED